MEKIKLPKRCKEILLLSNKRQYKYNIEDEVYLNLLVQEGLGDGHRDITHKTTSFHINNNGRAYLLSNPKLKNPSIWDDKKYLITTSIAILALLISVINSIITIINNG